MNNQPTLGQEQVIPRQTVKKDGVSTQYSRVYPHIRGGLCDACGVIDNNLPATEQYKLCPHYRGLQAECMYCDRSKSPQEVIRISDLYVFDHPYQKDQQGRPALAMVCDSFPCRNQFDAEFRK